jgi:hypothetical protein
LEEIVATQAQFSDFLADIEPSSTTKENSIKAHCNLREHLAKHPTYKDVHVRTFLSGSYRRNTAVRPRIKNGEADRPDIDIVVVTNYTRDCDPESVIDELFQVLAQKYKSHRKQGRSVGVFTAIADMDVVPIIEEKGFLDNVTMYVPDRQRRQWIETNPPGHTDWTTDVNKWTGDRFKPLVKLVKWWRRENPWWDDKAESPERKPKGFQLECIVAQNMSYSETQWDELFVSLIERIADKYGVNVFSGTVPNIDDPAVPGNDVMAGVSPSVFKRFYAKAVEHAEMGREAIELEASDPEAALALWRKIFGTRFPAPGATKSLSASSNITPAITPSFPNHKVVPDRGPKGFA